MDKNIENAYYDANKELIKKTFNGLIFSIISLVLFWFCFIPFLYYIVISPIIDAYNGADITGWPLLVGIAGGFILIPAILSMIFGILSIGMYKKCTGSKSKFRKFFNILTIFSLIVLIIFFVTLIMLFIYLNFLIFV